MCVVDIEYKIQYTRGNIVHNFLFNNDTKEWFLSEKQAKACVEPYLSKIPESLLIAFKNEGWKITITNENLEKRYGYDFEIYGVTDREDKHIYVYSYEDAIKYGLGHEIGHFVDIYLGNVSFTRDWKDIAMKHKKTNIPPVYFGTGEGENPKDEYFADCFFAILK